MSSRRTIDTTDLSVDETYRILRLEGIGLA
jgi:Arc/MetJ family transcription regulator